MRNTKPKKQHQLPPIVRNSRISPEEVEEVLCHHTAILEACVVGIPGPVHGEKLIAFVALRDGLAASEQELRDLIRSRVADYISLEHFVFLPALPKESTGKVAHNTLKDQASAISAGFDSFAYNSIYHDGLAASSGMRRPWSSEYAVIALCNTFVSSASTAIFAFDTAPFWAIRMMQSRVIAVITARPARLGPATTHRLTDALMLTSERDDTYYAAVPAKQ